MRGFIHGLGEYHNDIINVNDIFAVCKWARVYAKYYRPDKDVNDPLYRLVISFYQLGDMIRLMNKSGLFYQRHEVSEAMGSFIFHAIAAMEMIDIHVDGFLYNKYIISSFETLRSYSENYCECTESLDLLRVSAQTQRQVLYYCMNRRNRFSKANLLQHFTDMVMGAIKLLEHRNWDIVIGLTMCMNKLIDNELSHH